MGTPANRARLRLQQALSKAERNKEETVTVLSRDLNFVLGWLSILRKFKTQIQLQKMGYLKEGKLNENKNN